MAKRPAAKRGAPTTKKTGKKTARSPAKKPAAKPKRSAAPKRPAKKAPKRAAKKAAKKTARKPAAKSAKKSRGHTAKSAKKSTRKTGATKTPEAPAIAPRTTPGTGSTQKRTIRWTEDQPAPHPIAANGDALTGRTMPDFSLQDQDGKTWTLSELKGRPFVVYFYPKDDTPGCTKEACAFRDEYAEYRSRGVTVLGVSADSVASHRRFADKYNLPFPLLSDPDRRLIEALGAWREKNLYGRKYMGIQRMTVIVGSDGTIVKEYPKVSPQEHAGQILSDLAVVA